MVAAFVSKSQHHSAMALKRRRPAPGLANAGHERPNPRTPIAGPAAPAHTQQLGAIDPGTRVPHDQKMQAVTGFHDARLEHGGGKSTVSIAIKLVKKRHSRYYFSD